LISSLCSVSKKIWAFVNCDIIKTSDFRKLKFQHKITDILAINQHNLRRFTTCVKYQLAVTPAAINFENPGEKYPKPERVMARNFNELRSDIQGLFKMVSFQMDAVPNGCGGFAGPKLHSPLV
jgi:hypothetical protein